MWLTSKLKLKHHDEWMEIIEGEADLTVENRTIRTCAGVGPIFIPRGNRHGLRCLAGVPMVMREWTTPTGRFKEW